MIQFSKVTKSFGSQELFREASFTLGPRERLGLIGRNGTGKTTLFKMILGLESVDEGQVQIPKNYQIASLSQHLVFHEKSILAEAITSLAPDEKDDVYKAERILMGLGFEREDLEKAPSLFSGGFQIRLNLAKCLLGNPQLLLLDEPTNYLDLLSLRWLRSFLIQFPGEVMLITHDREFLDSVTTHTMGIHRGKIKKIQGGTQKFYEQIALEEELYEQNRQSLDKKKKELESFITRFKAKASKATQAASRVKQLERLESLDELTQLSQMNLSFEFAPIEAKTLLNTSHLTFGYEEGQLLFENLSFSLDKKERLAIIGKNGKGKSTLLKIIAQELSPLKGEVKFHPLVKIGYFGQTNINRLNLAHTAHEEIHSENPELTTTRVRQILGSLMFPGDAALKKLSVLSGGEKSRVLLGKIIAKPANLLLLDEPTNHLDMESIEVLTDELQDFPGALIIVTHSELMLKNLATKIIYFAKGQAHFFLGTYEEFLEKIGWDEQDEESPKTQSEGLKKHFSRHERAQLIKERSRLQAPLKKQILQAEEKIMSAEASLKSNQQQLLAALEKNPQVAQEIVQLTQEISQIEKLIEEQFEMLETLTHELEMVDQQFSHIDS
jgi:ATP-binding cassette subfamily F protein 3